MTLLSAILIVVIFALLTAMYFQYLFLQNRYRRQIQTLKESMKVLKRECEEANARAEKYEDDFQRELNRISVLLTKFM
ncbi:MAG: hypothetical protein WCG06_05865 [Candidatus Omnitrophota bacterium]